MMSLSLESQISEWLRNCQRLAIMGIGNALRGDDAVGVEVVKQLRGKVPSRVKMLDCGTVPENFMQELESFKPTHVLMIDAANLETAPGKTRLIPPEEIAGFALSTHSMPLSFLAGIIHQELKSKVVLLGIQPYSTAFGEGLSPNLRKAAKQIAENIKEATASLS
jgi:hydrogenase 3 maturation protease